MNSPQTFSRLTCVALAICAGVVSLLGQAAGPIDFGDAPLPYPTVRTNNGAQHAIIQGFYLGARVDFEQDGQPDPNALGDDAAAAGSLGDEDGVKFPGQLLPDSKGIVNVVASENGMLDAWMDFDRNGSWADPGDQIFASWPLAPGTNTLTFQVPANARPGSTFARFRFSRKGGLSFTGFAPDGEVEDYRVQISEAVQTADLVLVKRALPNPVVAGETLTYTLVVQNNGPGIAAGVTVTDPLPATAAFVSATSSQGSCTQAVGVVTCALGSLAVGASANIVIAVVPSKPGLLTNNACVSASTPDPKEDSNCWQSITEVTAPPEPPRCDFTNKGTDFWLTFPANYAPDPTNRPQLSLRISGASNVTGQVTIPGLGFSTNWSIPATLTARVDLPWQADLADLNDGVTNKGIHVTAQAEVAVYALNHIPYTSDAYLALPRPVLGTEYVVLGYPNVQTDAPELNGSQFAIVAPDDQTTVTIIPPVATGGRAAGLPFSISLNRGDAYQLRNTNNAPSDLSGSIITASKPIAVFGGHPCANIQGSSVFFCDTVVEQLLPVTAWGTNFVSMPLASRLKGDNYRITAAQPGTTVKTNGAALAVLARGGVSETLVSGPVHITSDKPIMVAQYSNSSDHDSVTAADPFMTIVPPTRLFREDYTVFSMDTGFTNNFLNVVAPSALVGQIKLDGSPIASSAFSTIAASGFSGAQIAVLPGTHLLSQSSTSPQGFGVTVYGFAEFDSYGYPGGMRFGDTQAPVIDCPQPLTLTLDPKTCLATVPLVQATVQDNCAVPAALKITQTPAPGAQLGPGTYELVLSSSDQAGNVGSCATKLTVVDSSPPAIHCPSNMVVRTRGSIGEVVTFKVSASTGCNTNLEVVCKPPSGARFPIGTNTVTCIASSGGVLVECSFTITIIPLRIDVAISKEALVLRWGGNDLLESAPAIAGPWKQLKVTSPYSLSLRDALLPPRQFYRLRCVDCP